MTDFDSSPDTLADHNHPAIKTVVVYTTAPWDHALAVLRFVTPLHMAGITPLHGNPGGQIDPDKVSLADLVLIQRDFPRHLPEYEQILAAAHALSKPVVFDLDDWLLELPENHPDRLNHHYAEGLFPMLRAIMEADAVTVSTRRLAERIHSLNNNITVLPNYIDDGVWSLTPRQVAVDRHLPLSIVYMGGDSHIPDFEPLVTLLSEILGSYGERVVYKSVGMQPPPALRSLPNVETIPFQHTYSAYADFVQKQHLDIGIAPLANNIFNHCKSSIKYLEYSALGIPGVFSSITPYAELVADGVNGFLASDLQEWRLAITRLIEDAELRAKIGAAAQESVRQQWLLKDHAWRWQQAYQRVAANTGQERAHAMLPISLFAELTRQSRRWELDMDSSQSVNHIQLNNEPRVAVSEEENSGSPQNTSAQENNGLAGSITRGLKWISSHLPPRQRR